MVLQGNLDLINAKLSIAKLDLNKKERPNINLGGKFWAKYAIEKMGEMNIWWK